jgi:hypothetical protein
VVEGIIATYTPEGRPTAAPMGLYTEDLERIVVKPYKDTLTYRNMVARGCATANLTHEPELYYYTTFKDANPGGQLPAGWFEEASKVDAPALRPADVSIELEVEEVKGSGMRGELVCTPVSYRVRVERKAYSRAAFALIESLIHATRVEPYLEQGLDVAPLVARIQDYRALVRRVAPGTGLEAMMEDLWRRVEGWLSSRSG